MDTLIKRVVVEDEMLIDAKISMLLTNLGYDVSAILPRCEEAIAYADQNRPDIILLDINLKGKMDGTRHKTLLRPEMRRMNCC